MIQAFGALITSGLGDVLNRYIMSKKKVHWKKFITVAYIYYAIILIPFAIFFENFTLEIINLEIVLLLILSVTFSSVYSIFRNIGLENLKIETIEPLFLLQWVFAIFLAFIFFKNERNYLDIFLALAVVLTVFWGNSNPKKIKFKKNKFIFYAILSSLFGAIGAIVAKKLLFSIEPITLGCLRALIISIVLFIWVRPKIKDFTSKSKYYSLLGCTDALAVVLILWSYQEIGIISTSMILTTYPVLSEAFSKVILKEKLHFKKIIATLISVILILVSFIY